jgi:hypothetical protein
VKRSNHYNSSKFRMYKKKKVMSQERKAKSRLSEHHQSLGAIPTALLPLKHSPSRLFLHTISSNPPQTASSSSICWASTSCAQSPRDLPVVWTQSWAYDAKDRG